MSDCLIDQVFDTRLPCTKACERLSRKGVRGEVLSDDLCPWHINSDKHFNCFWIYVLDENSRKEHQLTEIAHLLRTSVNNIKLVESSALTKLKQHLTHLKQDHS